MNTANGRREQKRQSRRRIVDAAARLMRRDGMAPTAVAEVMAAAGLTHGGFYGHFPNKEALTRTAFRAAMAQTRRRWLRGLEGLRGRQLLRWLAGRYLTPEHLEARADGCPLPALAAEIGRGDDELRDDFSSETRSLVAAIAEGIAIPGAGPEQADDRAMAFLALCVGAMTLARASGDQDQADRILRACRAAAPELADGIAGKTRQQDGDVM
ncbi:MAG: TetR/AcrR family transcriptional regulator [Alphaproteobacteria bacterium]|jgi:TetR/AcrR family transcriptional repressor of nem operon|nr:TetR/AcrR family transcriptional regulator [Alphaproteobacteria bacterium]MDP6565026.1 TetR/AcrR family transcriptional regulator [Alphaproteobacteria bacterium]MDP6811963.1 TetR/AcrR family transcriptional regulator [Alphaproteobacteria bacterium]